MKFFRQKRCLFQPSCAVILLILTCFQLKAMHIDSGEALLRYIKNNQDAEEVEKAIEHFKGSFDEAALIELKALIIKSDSDLLESAIRMLGRNGYQSTVTEIAINSIKDGADKPARAIIVLDTILSDPVFSKDREKLLPILSPIFLKLLSESLKSPSISPLLKEGLSAGRLFSAYDPVSYSQVLIKIIESSELNAKMIAMNWLLSTKAGPSITVQQIDTLIPYSKTETELSENVGLLLTLVTHTREPSWTEWWGKNKSVFAIGPRARTVAADSKADLKERSFAINQLSTDAAFEQNINTLSILARDSIHPLSIRQDAIRSIAALIRHSKKNKQDEVFQLSYQALMSLLEKTEYSEIEYILAQLKKSGVLELKNVENTLLNLVKDEHSSPHLRAAIMRALSTPEKREMLGPLVLDFLRKESPLAVEASWPAMVAAEAYRTLTGVNLGDNPMTLPEALDNQRNIGLNRDHTAQERTEILKKYPIAETKYRIEVESAWCNRSVKFASGVPITSQEIQLVVALAWDANIPLVSAGGFILQEIVLDSGEVIRNDWQRTLLFDGPIKPWYHPTKGVGKKEITSKIVLPIGKPIGAFKGISKLNGYLVIKRANSIKQIKISPPGIGAKKNLEIAEISKAQPLMRQDDAKKLTFVFQNDLKKYAALGGIVFKDGGDKIIPFSSRISGDHYSWHYDFDLEEPITENGGIEFAIFENILEERVPIDLKDIFFDPNPIKPPTPPEF